MLIDIPVTIKFDCKSKSAQDPLDHARVFTMRYDTTDTDKPAQWINYYPPRADSHWIADTQGVLFDLLTSGADKAIKKSAEADPETYCSNRAEGKLLAEEIEQTRAHNGQFGVGA
jgi:hypothetical protein